MIPTQIVIYILLLLGDDGVREEARDCLQEKNCKLKLSRLQMLLLVDLLMFIIIYPIERMCESNNHSFISMHTLLFGTL
jgi:hypothetical protein